jgi:PhnB protein
MTTQISPMLAVTDGNRAIDFYKAAFGAELLWKLGDDEDGADIVAGLAIGGAKFFLATQSPEFGTRGPSVAGFTTVRIELFVDDPVTIQKNAVAAGAKELNPVAEDTFETSGTHPVKRVLQGAVSDPFGHFWLIGKILA